MDFRVRNDAMWFSTSILQSLDNDLTHPTAIRAYAKKLEADLPPTPDLILETPTRLTASIEQVAPQAKRINKLVAMAELGEGQEKETAQRYLNKKAKEFGMEAAAAQAALAAPKVLVYDTVVADKELTLSTFVRMFQGVNTMAVQKDLTRLGYLFKQGALTSSKSTQPSFRLSTKTAQAD